MVPTVEGDVVVNLVDVGFTEVVPTVGGDVVVNLVERRVHRSGAVPTVGGERELMHYLTATLSLTTRMMSALRWAAM